MKINLSISLLFIALSSPASANLMIDGGIAGNTENGSTVNDVIHNRSGYYGANLKVDTDSIVTFEFLGSEAGWDNIFGYGPSDSPTNTIENHPAGSSGTVLASDSASYEQSFSVLASAGSLLDFFKSELGLEPFGHVACDGSCHYRPLAVNYMRVY